MSRRSWDLERVDRELHEAVRQFADVIRREDAAMDPLHFTVHQDKDSKYNVKLHPSLRTEAKT